jgi:hypothetical protein
MASRYLALHSEKERSSSPNHEVRKNQINQNWRDRKGKHTLILQHKEPIKSKKLDTMA